MASEKSAVAVEEESNAEKELQDVDGEEETNVQESSIMTVEDVSAAVAAMVDSVEEDGGENEEGATAEDDDMPLSEFVEPPQRTLKTVVDVGEEYLKRCREALSNAGEYEQFAKSQMSMSGKKVSISSNYRSFLIQESLYKFLKVTIADQISVFSLLQDSLEAVYASTKKTGRRVEPLRLQVVNPISAKNSMQDPSCEGQNNTPLASGGFVPVRRRKDYGNGSFACAQCPRCFKEKRFLRQHCLRHAGVKNARCHECNKDFLWRSDLVRHQRSVHGLVLPGAKTFPCGRCGESLPTKAKLIQHELVHEKGEYPFECQQCGKRFSEARNLQTHQSRVHQAERPHECDTCGKRFSTSAHLSRHESTHTGIKRYLCHRCCKGFVNRADLLKHAVVHAKGDNGLFHCTYCEQSFASERRLLKHEAQHRRQGEKPLAMVTKAAVKAGSSAKRAQNRNNAMVATSSQQHQQQQQQQVGLWAEHDAAAARAGRNNVIHQQPGAVVSNIVSIGQQQVQHQHHQNPVVATVGNAPIRFNPIHGSFAANFPPPSHQQQQHLGTGANAGVSSLSLPLHHQQQQQHFNTSGQPELTDGQMSFMYLS